MRQLRAALLLGTSLPALCDPRNSHKTSAISTGDPLEGTACGPNPHLILNPLQSGYALLRQQNAFVKVTETPCC